MCHEVQVEPTLQPLSGEHFDHATLNTEDGARLDVAMNGFFGVADVKSLMLMLKCSILVRLLTAPLLQGQFIVVTKM